MDTNKHSALEAALANRSSEGAPPVHPHLVDHLRRQFPMILPAKNVGRGYTAEECLAHCARMEGEQAIIDYLEGLSQVPPSFVEGTFINEPAPPESPGPDSRRPGTRARS